MNEKEEKRCLEIVLSMEGGGQSSKRKGCVNYSEQPDGKICRATTNKSCADCQFYFPSLGTQREKLFKYCVKKDKEVQKLTEQLTKANEDLALIRLNTDKALELFLFLFARSGLQASKRTGMKWSGTKICNDPRECFARKKDSTCSILDDTPAEEGTCSFCKPKRKVTDGKTFE